MEWLTGDFLIKLNELGAWPLLALFYALGWTRPRAAVTEVRQDRDARVAEVTRERDEWREAHRLSEEAREKLAATNREQLELTRAAVAALEGFRLAAATISEERGHAREVAEPTV